jgi:hypothetical protein
MALLGLLSVAYPHQPAHAGALFFDLYRQSKLCGVLLLNKTNILLFFEMPMRMEFNWNI